MTTQTSISSRAWIELLLLGAIWGGSFLSIRIALDEVPFLTTVAHRTTWAMIALWLIVLLTRQGLPKTARLWFAFLIMGLLNNVIPFGLMAWGQLHIESSLTSIFNAATAIFGVIAASFFFADEKLTGRKLLGVVIGFLGVTTAIGLQNLRDFDIRSLAQLAVLAGTISYAFAGVWARKTMSGVAPTVAAAGMLTGSTVIILPLAFVFDGPFQFDLAPKTWGAIGYYSLIATAGAYMLYYRVLAMVGSGNLMLVTLLIPPVAIVLGHLVLDETLESNAYVGFAILALGLSVLDGRLWRRRN